MAARYRLAFLGPQAGQGLCQIDPVQVQILRRAGCIAVSSLDPLPQSFDSSGMSSTR